MAHPFSHEAKSSQKARLKRLGATAGKSFGSSSMYKASSYPSERAGSSTPMTISGGKGKNRPDRFAAGGGVGKKSRRPHATTNIIISHAGGRGGSGGGGGAGPPTGGGPVPVPVNRPVPVPVPVGAGAGPMGPGGPPLAVRPPIAVRPPMPVAGPPMPVRPPMVPPGGGLPPGAVGPPPMRPPGMKKGGWVKKAANGGFLKESSGKGYKGFPNSPTTEVADAVSARKHGGGVKKRQMGGGMGPMGGGGLGGGLGGGQAATAPPGGGGLMGLFPGRQPVGPQQGPPTISGRPMIQEQALTVPMPRSGSSLPFARASAPGTTVGYSKKGGAIKGHDDEAQDRQLFKRMIKQEDKAEKRARGGGVNPGHNPPPRGMPGSVYHQQGKGLAAGGLVKTPLKNTTGGGAGGKGRLAKTRAAKSVPDATEL